ncbi:MAG: polysaccharide deacetylase family protein [Acidobacteriota bacterium]|nr:polysaccharide deacetylase family protein [Acidobacteriota bacterium]
MPGEDSIIEWATGLTIAGGAGLTAWAAVSPWSELFGPVLRRADSPVSMPLTFDDGPNPAITPALLDLLERYGARGTFFMIGRHVRANPQLAAEVLARGHAIGNHTETHPNLIWLSPARIREELLRCQEAIEDATGHGPRWMRPPYGFRGPQLAPVLRKGGWAGMALWSRAMFDWKPQPPGKMIRRMARARGGEILLMHDGDPFIERADRSHVLRSLEQWLPRWAEAGIKFPTIDDLTARSAAIPATA